MKKISDNVLMYKLYLFFNLYVIKGKNGDILIDSGFLLSKKLIDKVFLNNNIKILILTHAHIDHIWNAAYIQHNYHCKIYMSEKDILYLDNSKINSIPVNKHYVLRTKLMNYGMKYLKAKKFNIDKKLNDGDIINEFNIKLKIFSLSGHTYGSIGILYNEIFFVGDALVNRKPYIELSYQMQNKTDALASAKKIIDLNPKLICVGHEKPFKISKLKKSYLKILQK